MTVLRIKVCGMRDADNIAAVAALPIDYMGFIFYEKSPRFVHNQEAAVALCPSSIAKIGVFVNAPLSTVAATVKHYGLAGVQLHGQETPDYMRQLKVILALESPEATLLFKAFSVDSQFDFGTTAAYEALSDLFIFDTKTPQHGGSGLKFDWELLAHYTGSTPFLLSGGLSADDADAIRHIQHPQLVGLDLNSRFETAPGVKNTTLLANFLRQIQAFH